MFVCKVQDAFKELQGKIIFQNACIEVEAGQKVAIVGRNGAGKTTFLRCLLGVHSFDGGVVQRGVPVSEWGWLQQDVAVDVGVSAFEYVASSSSALQRLRADLAEALNQLENCGATDGGELAMSYASLLEQYGYLRGYEWETSIETTLSKLGLSRGLWHEPFRTLSGGQKTKVLLARLLVQQPKVLVLDEPTNHLDAETLVWLEQWLCSYKGTVILVTHDRTLMDRVINVTYELTTSGTKRYMGGYTAYREQKELERKTQQAVYDKQQKERRALAEAIQRYREWYQSAHSAASERDPFAKKRAMKNATRFKAKEAALERLEKQSVDRPTDAPSARIEFSEGNFEANTLLTIGDGVFGYTESPVLTGIHLRVLRGDKVAVIGPNGCGKSTLLKGLTGRLQMAHGVSCHPQVKVGYFEQELRDLDLSLTVLDTLLGLPSMTQTYARTVLAGFLFPNDDVFKRVGDLSLGERCRVAFVKLYFSGANLLVLDEPSNYLDVDTRERVEDALMRYPGALIVVSHDRYLLGKVANRVWDLAANPLADFHGTYGEYMEQLQSQDNHDVDTANQIQQLELLLAQYVSVETETIGMTGDELMRRVREVQSKLDALRG